jgi:hypothetical protein
MYMRVSDTVPTSNRPKNVNVGFLRRKMKEMTLYVNYDLSRPVEEQFIWYLAYFIFD